MCARSSELLAWELAFLCAALREQKISLSHNFKSPERVRLGIRRSGIAVFSCSLGVLVLPGLPRGSTTTLEPAEGPDLVEEAFRLVCKCMGGSKMAERALSPDKGLTKPLRLHRAGDCSPRNTRATSKGASQTNGSKNPLSKKAVSVLDKVAKRCHKALEKQFSKVQQQAQELREHTVSFAETELPTSLQPALSPQFSELPSAFTGGQEEDFLPLSGLASTGLQSGPVSSRGSAPKATFTPTMAGLRPEEAQGLGLSQDISPKA